MAEKKAERWAKTHADMLATAARMIRGRGLKAPSVSEVMSSLGLTVGGFYGHFESKEALFDEALGTSLRQTWERLLSEVRHQEPAERLRSILRRYLSRSHRDIGPEGTSENRGENRGDNRADSRTGCPLPATLGEIATAGDPYRTTVAAEVEHFAAELSRIITPPQGGADARKLALGLLVIMVGGISLSRALAGTALSDAILEASRHLAYSVLATHARGVS